MWIKQQELYTEGISVRNSMQSIMKIRGTQLKRKWRDLLLVTTTDDLFSTIMIANNETIQYLRTKLSGG